MKRLLQTKFGYHPRRIFTLMDRRGYRAPTSRNIQALLTHVRRLAYTLKTKEVTVYYSGHGTQVADRSGDEKDRKDEAIVPADFASAGLLTDDKLTSLLLSHLQPTVNFTGVFDCCNSGTVMDLPYRTADATTMVKTDTLQSRVRCHAVTLSGCRDPQTSASARGLERNRNTWRGAMTVSLERALRRTGYRGSCHAVLEEVRAELKRLRMTQYPILCSNRDTNPSEKRFMRPG